MAEPKELPAFRCRLDRRSDERIAAFEVPDQLLIPSLLPDAICFGAEPGHLAPQISLATRGIKIGEGAVELEDQFLQLDNASGEIGVVHVNAPARISRR